MWEVSMHTRALRVLTVLSSLSWHLHPPSLPIGQEDPFKLNPGPPLFLPEVCWRDASLQLSYVFAFLGHAHYWSGHRPAGWLPGLTSDVFHQCGLVWCSLGCVWPWLLLSGLILTSGLISSSTVDLPIVGFLHHWGSWLNLAAVSGPALLAPLGMHLAPCSLGSSWPLLLLNIIFFKMFGFFLCTDSLFSAK